MSLGALVHFENFGDGQEVAVVAAVINKTGVDRLADFTQRIGRIVLIDMVKLDRGAQNEVVVELQRQVAVV